MRTGRIKPISLSRFQRAITPRALEHWKRPIGAAGRIEIQAMQLAKAPLYGARALLPGRVAPVMDRGIAWLEARIKLLQIDVSLLRERYALALREVARYKRLFRDAPIGMHTLRPDGKIIGVNERWIQILGYSRSEVTGRYFWEFVVPEQRENAKARFLAKVRGEPLPPQESERRFLTKAGREIIVITFDSIHRGADGKAGKIQTSFQDITELRERERELKILEEALIIEEQQAAVGRVASAVFHRIKNKIQVVLSTVEKLQREFAELQAAFATQMSAEARQDGIARLMGNLGTTIDLLLRGTKEMDRSTRATLGFARTAGEGELTTVVRDRAEEVGHVMDVVAGQSGVELRVEIAEVDERDLVGMDDFSLKDVLQILLENAIQAFPEGGDGERIVTLRVEPNGEELIRITVSDNGMGIPEAVREQLFKVPVATTKGQRGTGIGAWIVGRNVENAGGTIRLKSTPGEGTTVIIDLPRSRALTVDKTAAIDPVDGRGGGVPKNIKIWVVDDEEMILTLVKEMLSSFGFINITTFPSAAAAWQEYGREEGERPDLIITDLTMPEMSGDELFRVIIEKGGVHFPAFIFSTGCAHETDLDALIEKHKRKTPVALLAKPFCLEALLAAVENVAPRGEALAEEELS